MLQLFGNLFKNFIQDDNNTEVFDKETTTEEQVNSLKKENLELQELIRNLKINENEFQDILLNYDDILGKIIHYKKILQSENNTLERNLRILHIYYKNLYLKYEKIKVLLYGYKNNEEIFLNKIKEYETLFQDIKENIISNENKWKTTPVRGKNIQKVNLVKD